MYHSYYIRGLHPKPDAESVREYLGIQGAIEDALGPTGGQYRFDSVTAASDPGAGKLRLDAGTWAAAANIYIDSISDNGVDATPFLSLFGTGDVVVVQDRDDSTRFGRYTLSGNPTNNSGWFTIPLTHVRSSGDVPGNNERIVIVGFFNA